MCHPLIFIYYYASHKFSNPEGPKMALFPYDVKAIENKRTIEQDFSNKRPNQRLLIFVIISSYGVPNLASATTDVRIFVYIALFACTVDILESNSKG